MTGSTADDAENGAGESKKQNPPSITGGASRTVLTLYANATPEPRQLFSSLQQPTRMTISQASQTLQDGATGVEMSQQFPETFLPPLRERALPINIFTAKVVPVHGTEGHEKKPNPTIGDSFPPPSTMTSLNPPQQSRHTSTRSQSVNWYGPREAVPPRSKGHDSYTKQALPSGQWLTYNVSPPLFSSTGERRKQRDRALSSGEPKSSQPSESIAAHQQARQDALFQSCYSSFAPSHDDTGAIVPEQRKNRLWWSRIGRNKYLSPPLSASVFEAAVQPENSGAATEESDEDRRFREAVDSWEPLPIPIELESLKDSSVNAPVHDQKTDEILTEISELLETLDSYQRVRNLSLVTNARPGAGQNPQLTAMSGSPTTPSAAEIDVYNVLKSQLALIVSTLPPYAVAKLNGDQLAALSISTRMAMESKDYKGTMGDYDFGVPAMPHGSVRTASTTVHPSARNSHYLSNSNTPTLSSVHTVRPSGLPAAFPSQQYSGRPPLSAGPYGSQVSYSGQPSSASQRQSFSAGPYGSSTPQGSSGQYTNGHRLHPGPNGYSSYNRQFMSGQPATSPGAMASSQYQRPSQPGYPQRAPSSHGYGYGSQTVGRSASPQTSGPTYTPQPSARPSYTSSGAHASSRVSLASAANAHAVALNGATGTVGQHINLTAEEQAMLMSRQKVQLAQQNQMNQIQVNRRRQASGTPQPVNNVSGDVGSKMNGAVVPQANGVMAGLRP